MDNRNFLITLLFVLIPGALFAQNDKYKLEFAPDLWYNSVDGIRVGARVLGDMEGTFQDGPHRLDAGMWLGTNFPDQPVSYYVSFTEPVPALSEFGEEFNVQLISSIRTGYNRHGVAINKRFQKGFDELRHQEIRVSVLQEKATENAYRLNAFQETDWKTLAGIDFRTSGFTSLGALKTHLSFQQNVNPASENFSSGSAEVKHLTELGKGFGLNLRAFGALVSSDAPLEYNYSMANRAPISWLNNGVTRASGTIPDLFFENGLVQIAGGFNLRGYSKASLTNSGGNKDYTISYLGTLDKGFSLNTELIFPNYLNTLLKRSIVGDFIHLKSYLFQDTGRISGIRIEDDISLGFQQTVADAGIGLQFSINIPDWLGKDRGLALRYEIPLWLSNPVNGEESFKFRNLIGIGAVISL